MTNHRVSLCLKTGVASRILSVAFFCTFAATALTMTPRPAQAIPAFARQTGQPCGACHTDFPQLTPFGRRFKLGGYTATGGRTSDTYQRVFGSSGFVPGFSFMAVTGATQQNVMQDSSGPKPIQPQATFSEFYGGTIVENTGTLFDNIGVFQQATYTDGNGLHNFSWDNTDFRYADRGYIGKFDFIYGITANNNPTVQDVWNTVPAWAFPFPPTVANLNTPTAGTLIEGAFAQRVIGVSAYTFINDMFYLEFGGYKGVNPAFLDRNLGVDPTGQPGTIDRLAPYARIAVEPHWGDHWLEVGAFGMRTDVNPAGLSPDLFLNPFQVNAGVTQPFIVDGTDRYTDVGVDAQYQYMGDKFKVTVRGSFIHEDQLLNATFGAGNSANPTNFLNSFKANASIVYGQDSRVVFSGGYFNTWGSTDTGLYAFGNQFTGSANGSPNSSGWTAEIAYIPFGMSRSPLWPYANARIGLLYTAYDKFNGATSNYDGFGTNARDNNSIQAYFWVSF